MAPRKHEARKPRRSKRDDRSSPGHGISKKIKDKLASKAKARRAVSANRCSTWPKLSALEQLPTELLQEIFLLAPNLSLPLASPCLGKALSSDYIKTELVIRAFSSAPKEQTRGCTNPYRDMYGCLYHGYSGGFVESQSLCQTLLSQKWLTYAFFKRCQKTYILRVAQRQLRTLGKASSDVDQAKALEHVHESFERYTSTGGYYLSLRNKSRHGKVGLLPGDGSYVWQRPGSTSIAFALLCNGSSLRVDVIKGGQWPSSIICRNGGHERLYQDFSSVWHNGASNQEASFLTQFPGRISNCYIPEKLLHGPWLQEKGDFLTLLLIDRVGVNRSVRSTMGEVASKGLEDAIRENNILAVSCLLGVGSCAGSGTCHHKDYDECTRSWLGYEKTNGMFRESGPSSHQIPEPPSPRGPWKRFNCPPMALNSVAMVKPTTDHLKIALFEMDGCNEFIVKALMGHYGHHTLIDYHEPEIQQWSFANYNRPTQAHKQLSLVYPNWEKPVSGQMFMELLDEAQNQQTARLKKNKCRREKLAERRADERAEQEWAHRAEWDGRN